MTPRTLIVPIAGLAISLPLVTGSGTAHAADPIINVGATEVVAAPDVEHVGVYPYVAGSLAFPLSVGVLIPSLGVEMSPELSRWGFVAVVTFDVPMTPRIGLDVLVSAIHDQDGGDWGGSAFLAGGGLGMSFVVDRFVVSPSISLFGGLNTPGWSVVPGLNLAYGL